MRPPLPAGRVTFVFTDVVSSTQTFMAHGEAYAGALTRLHALTQDVVERHGGRVVETEGDGAMLAFPTSTAAVLALTSLQEQVERAAATTAPPTLRMRSGAHVGDAFPVADHYLAMPVYLAARVAATANAGQLLVSGAVVDELAMEGTDVVGRVLGDFDLKDVPDPVTLWALVGDDAPPRARVARRTNVSAPRTSFVGRRAELAALDAAAIPGALVTLVGAGGVGKTRLVSHWALGRSSDDTPMTSWMVELAALPPDASTAEVGAHVAATLGVPGLADVVDRLGRALPSCLVLDNCEHLLDAAAEVAEVIVDGCRTAVVVATSRQALGIPAETVIRTRPLPVSSGDEDGAVASAAALFVDRAASAGTVLDPSAPEVERLCRTADGHPLALELLAAQVGTLPLAVLADRGVAAVTPRRAGPGRQRSIEALVAWSLDLLGDDVVRAFAVLSQFPGRFRYAAAIDVVREVGVADPALPIGLLASHHLVDLDGNDVRLLAPVRQVALARLQAETDLRVEGERAFARWAEDTAADLCARHAGDQIDADLLLALEAALLAAGVGRGAAAERPDRRAALWTIVSVNRVQGVLPAVVLQAAIDEFEALSHASEPRTLTLHAAVARVLHLSGDMRAQHLAGPTVMEDLLERARLAGEDEVLMRCAHLLALKELNRGESVHAEDYLLEAAAAAERLGHPPWIAVMKGNLGVVASHRGDLQAWEQATRDSLSALSPENVGYPDAVANLGEALLARGRPVEAVELVVPVVQTLPERDLRARALLQTTLAAALFDLGKTVDALDLARRAMAEAAHLLIGGTDGHYLFELVLSRMPELAVALPDRPADAP